MNLFQIITVCFGFVTVLSGIVISYTSTMVTIAKIQVQIKNLEHDSDQKERAILRLENQNSLEHEKIVDRLNALIDKVNEK